MTLEIDRMLELPQGLPSGDALPDSDGEPLDDEWVADVTRLYLIDPLKHYFAERKIVAFVGGNSFVYYLPVAQFLGPDFYVVRGGSQSGQSKWVAWEEGGLLPTTIIEFVSPSTESRDRGEKFCIYRDVFKTEDYFLVDPKTLWIDGFTLKKGHYLALKPDADGWFYARSLGLYLGSHGDWIRLRTPEGKLLPTGRELAESERARADEATRRADEATRRADEATHRAEQSAVQAEAELRRSELLAEKLRSLGIDPNKL